MRVSQILVVLGQRSEKWHILMCEQFLSSESELWIIVLSSPSQRGTPTHSSSEMFQRHQYENVRPVSSDRVRNVRMEIRLDETLPQSGADTQRAKISPGQAYENVSVTESGVRKLEEDPFEGFEEAIKNSEVISIKKVIFCIIVVYLYKYEFSSLSPHIGLYIGPYIVCEDLYLANGFGTLSLIFHQSYSSVSSPTLSSLITTLIISFNLSFFQTWLLALSHNINQNKANWMKGILLSVQLPIMSYLLSHNYGNNEMFWWVWKSISGFSPVSCLASHLTSCHAIKPGIN